MPLSVRLPFVVCLIALVTAPVSARRQPTLEFVWAGTATVSDVFHPGRAFDPTEWSGSVRDDRTVQVRVKEDRHIDVTDDQGRLIGQITFLVDNGSTWAGSVQHAEVHLGSVRISGTGSGSGKAMAVGAIYRSAVTPNPLADVLADGTYYLYVGLDGPISYTQTITEPNRKPEVSQSQSTSAFSSGDMRLGYWLTTTPNPATAAALRASLARPVPPGVVTIDGPRVLAGGRMAGTYGKEYTSGDAKGTMLTADWDLAVTTNLRVTLTETPAEWRPTWNGDTSVTASVDPALGVKGRFRFTLDNVSHEKGYAMNSGTTSNPDLGFPEEQPQPMVVHPATSEGPWIVETSEESTSATAVVRALDYGAWGRVKAEFFAGGIWVPAETSRGQAFASIPLDDNGDHIADHWMDRHGLSGHAANEDADSEPAGANGGDGFSNYEEYRGFVVGGSWTETDPTRKEVFVNNEASIDGCGDFSSTGLVCLLNNADEYDADRVVNFNRGHATAGPQKGLLLVSGTIGNGVLGQTVLAVPNEGSEITLDLGYIATFNELGVTDTGTFTALPVARASVIAHELGHAVNIDHHGNNDAGPACGGGLVGEVALWGGAYSGDRGCFMSYARAQRYQRADGSCHTWAWPHQWGSSICTSKAGTGINAGPDRLDAGQPVPASGDATHGDCQHQLRLRR